MKKFLVLFLFIALSHSLTIAQDKLLTKSITPFFEKILSEKIYFTDKQVDTDTLQWYAHPSFKGVYLKHLIVGNNTEGKLSCHVVKIDPNCELPVHLHDGKIEIHEVIGGYGTMYLDGK